MTGRALTKQFELCYRTVGLNLEGISHTDSLLRPSPAGNCINWVVGHILATRNSVHRILGLPPAWDSESAERYRRGSEAILEADEAVPLDDLRDGLRASQDSLATALASITEEELSEAAGDDALGIQLAFLSFHESYHAGQLGLLRRLTGRPGAIR